MLLSDGVHIKNSGVSLITAISYIVHQKTWLTAKINIYFLYSKLQYKNSYMSPILLIWTCICNSRNWWHIVFEIKTSHNYRVLCNYSSFKCVYVYLHKTNYMYFFSSIYVLVFSSLMFISNLQPIKSTDRTTVPSVPTAVFLFPIFCWAVNSHRLASYFLNIFLTSIFPTHPFWTLRNDIYYFATTLYI